LRPRRFVEPVRPVKQDRVNDAIRAPRVRLIDDDGAQLGIKTSDEARDYAYGKNLDLVEVASNADPPVVRVMDYGKWRYEQEQKAKQARRHQSTITIKEIKFRPKIDPHDYVTKKGHVERFLRHRDKVKITIMFRGRELLHPERGEAILLRLADELKDLALVESRPNLDGRNMVMMLAPLKNPTPTAAAGGPSEGDETPEPTEPTEAQPAPESTPAVVGGGPSKGDEPPEPAQAEPAPE
jgi:translation initiation factor IF-3